MSDQDIIDKLREFAQLAHRSFPENTHPDTLNVIRRVYIERGSGDAIQHFLQTIEQFDLASLNVADEGIALTDDEEIAFTNDDGVADLEYLLRLVCIINGHRMRDPINVSESCRDFLNFWLGHIGLIEEEFPDTIMGDGSSMQQNMLQHYFLDEASSEKVLFLGVLCEYMMVFNYANNPIDAGFNQMIINLLANDLNNLTKILKEMSRVLYGDAQSIQSAQSHWQFLGKFLSKDITGFSVSMTTHLFEQGEGQEGEQAALLSRWLQYVMSSPSNEWVLNKEVLVKIMQIACANEASTLILLEGLSQKDSICQSGIAQEVISFCLPAFANVVDACNKDYANDKKIENAIRVLLFPQPLTAQSVNNCVLSRVLDAELLDPLISSEVSRKMPVAKVVKLMLELDSQLFLTLLQLNPTDEAGRVSLLDRLMLLDNDKEKADIVVHLLQSYDKESMQSIIERLNESDFFTKVLNAEIRLPSKRVLALLHELYRKGVEITIAKSNASNFASRQQVFSGMIECILDLHNKYEDRASQGLFQPSDSAMDFETIKVASRIKSFLDGECQVLPESCGQIAKELQSLIMAAKQAGLMDDCSYMLDGSEEPPMQYRSN